MCCIGEDAVVDVCVLDERPGVMPFAVDNQGYAESETSVKDISEGPLSESH